MPNAREKQIAKTLSVTTPAKNSQGWRLRLVTKAWRGVVQFVVSVAVVASFGQLTETGPTSVIVRTGSPPTWRPRRWAS